MVDFFTIRCLLVFFIMNSLFVRNINNCKTYLFGHVYAKLTLDFVNTIIMNLLSKLTKKRLIAKVAKLFKY